MFKYIAIILITVSLFCSCAQQKETTSAIPVILDTDVGNDIDDVLAMQMLLNYEKKGKIDLLGITISKCNPYSLEYIDAYCRFNDKYDIPLGYAYNGMNTDDGHYLRQTLDTIIDNNKILHPKRSLKDHILEGYKLLRKLLAEQEDHSVVFIALGPETNLARLLISEADEYSELDGKALVAQKVKLLSVMGGLYGNEFDFPEWNIVNDLNAAQITFKEWPTPIMPYDRETWDLTSVLQAIEPGNNYFNLSEKGTITIDSIGQSIFSPSESGKHQYLTIQGEENIRATRNALIRQVTGKEN